MARGINKRTNSKILDTITKHYLDSKEFNGMLVENISANFTLSHEEIKKHLTFLIQEGKISLNYGDRHPNPFIKAFLEESPDVQISKLVGSTLECVCAYPSKLHLEKIVDKSKYANTPFTLRLALGDAQLSFLSFELSVLESYRNDPRYYYVNDDIRGCISIHDEYHETPNMKESDQILLQTFGFSYDEDCTRAVAVFLIYLSKLSPEHQQIWNSKLLSANYWLHPDYLRNSMGEWGEKIPIHDAFREELHHINQMCKLMGRLPLFKDELHDKPRNFSFLIRPTLKEFNDYIHLLDKAMSENINREFFQGDIEFEREDKRNDGKLIVSQKGTIQILDEWLKKTIKSKDTKPMEEMIATFKKIRKIRQHPAHVIDDNIFDQKYYREQQELIKEAYKAIRLIRLIFANHPCVKDYRISDELYKGKIWLL